MEVSLFQAAILGWQNLFDPFVLFALVIGVFIGTFTAVTPQGLGTPMVYAILLPFVVQWNPITSIALLIGASAVSAICAAYLPILFGIPGGAGSTATILDGHPMGRRGEARRALGASFMAGGMGSVIGTFTLALAIPVAKPLIYLMGSPELCVVVIWGLSMVAILAGRYPIRGLIAAAFGLLISTVGQQDQSGVMRFVFDQPYLIDGFAINVIALALFGIPSALDMALTRAGVEQPPAPLKGSLLDGVKDTLHEWWLVVRCSFFGVWVGIVPGIGSRSVDWLAYAHAVQSCKGTRESFGNGDVRGVIAPESANDAKDGGDLITTLFLGLPQGTTTALFIVALLAMGFVPGPQMVKNHADVIFSVVWIMGISGVLGTLVGFTLANPLAKLAQVRYTFMVPIIITCVLLGAFSANRDPADLLVVLSFGVIGYFMKRWRYPRPAMILGLILGLLLEKYLYRSMASYGFSWLLRPGVIGLLFLTFGSLALTLRGRLRKKTQAESPLQRTTNGKGMNITFRPEAVFTFFLLSMFLAAIVIGWKWLFIAKLMPVYMVAIPGSLLAMAQIYSDLTGRQVRKDTDSGDTDMDQASISILDKRTEITRTLVFLGWVTGGAVAIWLLGIVVGLPLFVLLYPLVEGKEKWRFSLLMSAGTYAMLWGLFEYLLKMVWPDGLLFQ